MGLPQEYLIYKTDWDYLLILDTCRYDYFSRQYKEYLDGKLYKAISKANRTQDWFYNTFIKPLPIIYYSATPSITSRHNFKFKAIKDVWDTHWDFESESVPPNALTNIILNEQPEKAIIHYLQPHFSKGNLKLSRIELYLRFFYRSDLTFDELKRVYAKNLDSVLKSIKKLSELNKKMVISADHGEMLGEDQLVFHEYSLSLYHPLLREVPWFIMEGSS